MGRKGRTSYQLVCCDIGRRPFRRGSGEASSKKPSGHGASRVPIPEGAGGLPGGRDQESMIRETPARGTVTLGGGGSL